jgi:hypothetical protein
VSLFVFTGGFTPGIFQDWPYAQGGLFKLNSLAKKWCELVGAEKPAQVSKVGAATVWIQNRIRQANNFF